MCLQQIDCVHNNAVMELMRGVRSQLTELISGLASQDLAPMSLGLSHSLSRYKLKFSPDKVICYKLTDLFHVLHGFGMDICTCHGRKRKVSLVDRRERHHMKGPSTSNNEVGGSIHQGNIVEEDQPSLLGKGFGAVTF